MPCISCQTNITISEEQAKRVKSRFGKAIELIPGKSEEWLMVSLIDKCSMSFQGKDDTAIAFVDLRVWANEDNVINFNPVSKGIITLLNEELGIPADKIYINFSKFKDWGWKDGDRYLL